MKAFVSYKHAEGEPGEWVSASDLPQKVLAESDKHSAAIKIGNNMFFFGTKTEVENIHSSQTVGQISSCIQKYRVLPKGAVLVLIQE